MSEQPNCKHYNRAGACYLCWHELVQECEGLRAQLATTPPADAAMVDDALCESLIEASDMRWNGDVYVGDGADLMNLVRAALRARAAPDGMVQVDINLIDDEWMNAAMRDAGIVRSVGAPPETIIRAAISGYLLAARNRWRRSEEMSGFDDYRDLCEERDQLRAELEASRRELFAYQADVEGANRRELSFATACVRKVEGITVGGALEMQRDEIASLRAELAELRARVAVPDDVAKDALEDLADTVSLALSKAWSLGQTYWSQADSESYKQNKKAAETQQTFNALTDATRAAILAAKEKGQ